MARCQCTLACLVRPCVSTSMRVRMVALFLDQSPGSVLVLAFCVCSGCEGPLATHSVHMPVSAIAVFISSRVCQARVCHVPMYVSFTYGPSRAELRAHAGGLRTGASVWRSGNQGCCRKGSQPLEPPDGSVRVVQT